MLHYKAFTSATCNDDIAALEVMVNDWMGQAHLYVHTMTQSSVGEHLVLSFLYEMGDEQNEEHMAVAVAAPEVFQEALREADLDPADELLVTLIPHAELPY